MRLPRGILPLRVLRVAISCSARQLGGGGGGGCVSGTAAQNSVGTGLLGVRVDRATAGGDAAVAMFSHKAVAEVAVPAAEDDNAGGGEEEEEEGRWRSLGEEGGVSRAHTLQRERAVTVNTRRREGAGGGEGSRSGLVWFVSYRENSPHLQRVPHCCDATSFRDE